MQNTYPLKNQETTVDCYHCGSDIYIPVFYEDKKFCCEGCKSVFEIINSNNLCDYYLIDKYSDKKPGLSPTKNTFEKYKFLDNPEILKEFYDYVDEKIASVTLDIPSIHCSSCIWLLENLQKINNGVLISQVNFTEKTIHIKFKKSKTSLKEIASNLFSLGYEPRFDKKNDIEYKKKLRTYYLKIGVSGFCFGNIMMLSFPEYLSGGETTLYFQKLFSYFCLLLSFPLIWCASEYYKSAYTGLKKKIINIDFPIALGISIVFLRSSYEIISGTGAGYFDSFSGLIFLLLTGKLLQQKTYNTLNFERDYKSYFPLAVTKINNCKEEIIPIEKIVKGDRLIIRNNEIIPADSILFNGNGNINYSFVTGESIPVEKVSGEILYAGGRQIGGKIEIETIRDVSQSYLTRLWKNSSSKKESKSNVSIFADFIGRNFTFGILIIVIITALIQIPVNLEKGLNSIIAVLIVACPCAFALSIPFALGNSMKILGKNNFYIKNISVIERLSQINEIVFDKTGTLTNSETAEIEFYGKELTNDDLFLVKSLTYNSIHPVSRMINSAIKNVNKYEPIQFREYQGKGIAGIVNCKLVKLGTKEFVYNNLLKSDRSNIEYNPELDLLRFRKEEMSEKDSVTLSVNEKMEFKKTNFSSIPEGVYLSVNNEIYGWFEIKNSFREDIENLSKELKHNYKLSIISGDNSREEKNLREIFGNDTEIHFGQTAQDKLEFIKRKETNGKKTLMIGDGLNDSGALIESYTGISVVENTNCFSPSSDAILESEGLNKLPRILKFCNQNLQILKAGFIYSLLYNAVGLYFAVSGQLTPLVAAILMPVSSISVVLFAVIATNIAARKEKLR
ncbi:MAG TPA: heavy metal translocating P-type ATPase metal-binding domain-containing protein [Ignavibacteria bacterium]|nr:heavy metal translocating P-type ATPase metal-binding domain-containing protein [Ignavibacteria bacterium]